MNKRLYTFGCSFTNYFYPTWADLIGSTFDVYENWGQSGAGNFYIGTQVYECNQLNKFTKDDCVLIMFTNYTRYDLINNNSEFMTCGNIYSQGCYGDDFIEKYWSPEHGFYTTWFSINSVYQLLKNIGCKFKLMLAFDLRLKNQFSDTIDNEFSKPRMIHCYDNLKNIVPDNNMKDYIEKNKHYKFDDVLDLHPTIKTHHDWIKNMLPEFYDEKMNDLLIEWEGLVKTSKRETILNFENLLNKSYSRFTNLSIKN